MKMLTALLVFLALPFHSLLAAATPEEMTILYFDAFKSGDMETVANNMHEGELVKFKEALLPLVENSMVSDPLGVGRDGAAIRQFAGKNSLDEIRAEEPKAFFLRFMNWMVKLNPMMIEGMKGATIHPLGFISENDMAHVTYRVTIDVRGANVSQLRVMSVKKQGDEWRLMMTGEIEGMGKLMQRNPKPQVGPVNPVN